MQEPTTPSPAQTEPKAARLAFPRGYAVPKGDELIPWSRVAERLEQSDNYWLATTVPDGRPHVAPLWGVWVDQALYFDGIPTARWARNLKVNPSAAIHLESGTDVVILDGAVEDFVAPAELGDRIVAAWTAKYGRLQPEPSTNGIFCFRPRSPPPHRSLLDPRPLTPAPHVVASDLLNYGKASAGATPWPGPTLLWVGNRVGHTNH